MAGEMPPTIGGKYKSYVCRADTQDVGRTKTASAIQAHVRMNEAPQ